MTYGIAPGDETYRHRVDRSYMFPNDDTHRHKMNRSNISRWVTIQIIYPVGDKRKGGLQLCITKPTQLLKFVLNSATSQSQQGKLEIYVLKWGFSHVNEEKELPIKEWLELIRLMRHSWQMLQRITRHIIWGPMHHVSFQILPNKLRPHGIFFPRSYHQSNMNPNKISNSVGTSIFCKGRVLFIYLWIGTKFAPLPVGRSGVKEPILFCLLEAWVGFYLHMNEMLDNSVELLLEIKTNLS